MRKYSSASEKMFSGVLIRRMIGVVAATPTTASTDEITAEAISDVKIAVLTLPIFFAPNSWEITTEQPILLPKATAIKIIVTG